MNGAIDVTDDDFAAVVAAPDTLVVVEFWAPWCGPCKAIAGTLEQVARERAGAVRIVKVNGDEHPKIGMRWNVRGLPTLLFFKGGVVVDRIVGAVAKPRIDEVIARHG